jgi:hypothetical protein
MVLAVALVAADAAVLLLELQPTTTVATHSPVTATNTPGKRVVERARLTKILREFRRSQWSP